MFQFLLIQLAFVLQATAEKFHSQHANPLGAIFERVSHIW